MVNGLHLYSAFIQSAVQFMPLIHPFTHTFTHQRRLAAMQGTNQLVRSNWGFGVLLRDTSTCPGWDRTGNPPTARRLLLPPELHRPTVQLMLLIHTFTHRLTLQQQLAAMQGTNQLIRSNWGLGVLDFHTPNSNHRLLASSSFVYTKNGQRFHLQNCNNSYLQFPNDYKV